MLLSFTSYTYILCSGDDGDGGSGGVKQVPKHNTVIIYPI